MGEWRLDVDQQRFLVRDREGEPGVYDFSWLTGPPSYGFSSASSDRSSMTPSQMRDEIRDFLSRVDPDTGYIE